LFNQFNRTKDLIDFINILKEKELTVLLKITNEKRREKEKSFSLTEINLSG
jgi:hypothetical protein